MSDSKHPAATNAEQLAWAVWVGEDLDHSEVYAVTGNSEEQARRNAVKRADSGTVVHVDGPYQDAEPGVWEFEFITENKETVVVEAPHEGYAEETAKSERDYRGELVQTMYTNSRKLQSVGDGDE